MKIRGYRIELGEVEARLAEHPAVREAVVVAREAASGRQLVGYVAGEGRDLEAALGAWLRERLPDYMVPAHFVVLPRLPVNANGKLDRAALPEPGRLRRDRVAPRNLAERGLAAIWQEVLGTQEVGVTDNFFELGGDSILTLKVVARVRGRPELGLDLKLRDLMLKPTIAQLCAGKEGPAAGTAPDPVLALNRALPASRPLFCLHAGFGTVFDYETLARRLDGEVPVLGLQCRMLLEPAWQDSSIQAMAQDYARHVRARQEHGPYRLLGWSLGGSLAVLVARLLEDQGQTVELCAVVDPYVPGEPGTGIAWRDELAAFLRFTLPQAGEPDPALLDRLQDMGDTAALAQLIGRHIAGAPAGPSPAAEELAQMFAVALRLRALSEAMPPLPRIAAEPTSWWLRGRESARRLFREQTGRPGRMRELDGTHFGLLRDPALLEGVAGALAATLEPA